MTFGQLRGLGLPRSVIEQRIREGWLIPRHRRVYAVGHVPRTRESRWMAGVLTVAGGAVLSARAAGALWGIVRGAVPTEVTVPTYAGRGHRDGIVVHRAALPPQHVTSRSNIPVTTLVRSVLDLAAVVHPRALSRAFEQAQVLHHLDPVLLAAEVECRRGHRGNARVRRMLAGAVDPAAVRSVLELRFLELCERHGIARPVVNARLGIWRPDFRWPEQRLVVETDSVGFHTSIAARRRDAAKDEDLAAAGVAVLRLRWRDVVETPAATAERLRAALGITSSVADPSAWLG